jgi:hypothetical protein
MFLSNLNRNRRSIPRSIWVPPISRRCFVRNSLNPEIWQVRTDTYQYLAATLDSPIFLQPSGVDLLFHNYSNSYTRILQAKPLLGDGCIYLSNRGSFVTVLSFFIEVCPTTLHIKIQTALSVTFPCSFKNIRDHGNVPVQGKWLRSLNDNV